MNNTLFYGHENHGEGAVVDADKHFIINPITRIIENQSTNKNSLVQYDHNSEIFTFKILREIEGHDMSASDKIEVHYVNKGQSNSKPGIYEVTDAAIITEENTEFVTFSWLISQKATQYVGDVSFQIKFICYNESDSTTPEYIWSTRVFSAINVLPGINNADIIVEEYADILAVWEQRLFGLSEEGVENVNTARINALNAIETEKTNSCNAIEQKGQSVVDSLPDDYISLSEKVSNAANAIKGTVRGESIVITDVSPLEHVMDVRLKNKNLAYDVSCNDVSLENRNVSVATASFSLEKGKTYTISFDTENTGGRITFTTYAKPFTLISNYTAVVADGNRQFFVFEVYEDYSIQGVAILQLPSNSPANSGLCSNLMIAEGIEVIDYVPHVAPENVTITKLGKNLFNKDAFTTNTANDSTFPMNGTLTKNGYKYTVVGNDGTNLGASSGSFVITLPKPLKMVGRDITISFFITVQAFRASNTTQSTDLRLIYRSGTTDIEKVTSSFAKKVRTKFVATFRGITNDLERLKLYVNGNTVDIEMDTLQIEFGGTATELQEYVKVEYIPNAEGIVENVSSLCPVTQLQTDTGNTFIECKYNKTIDVLAENEESNETFTEAVFPLAGKSILSFGDSIAEGAGSGFVSYSHIIAQNNDMSLTSLALSGARMRKVEGSDNSVCVQVDNAITNYSGTSFDFVLLEGGTNDVNEATLGDISSDYDTTTCDNSTFTGALEINISKIRNTWHGANIIYVLTHKMTTRNTEKQKTFHDRIVEVCNKWSIPYVDIYNNGQINSYIESVVNNYFPDKGDGTKDKTHPNLSGYERFYVPPITSKMKELV